jgi:hypothetical protein
MGKINAKPNVSNCTGWEDLMRYTSQFLQDCAAQVNGNLTFKDNLSIRLVGATFPTAFGTVIVPHGLGRTPQMWWSGSQVGSTAVISETRPADSNNVYLAASAICGAKILVI